MSYFKLENLGPIVMAVLLMGVFILALSTLFTSPLFLFLSIVGGTGLIGLGVIFIVIFMIRDIAIFFKNVDQAK